MSAKTTITTTASGIMRTNRMFVSLNQIGECDEKGKVIFASTHKGKVIADPGRPVATCILPLVIVLLERAHYVSTDEAAKDLESLKRYVNNLKTNDSREAAEQARKAVQP
jgi:hypothetical protein